ncbi:hypothetical protein [Streptomyces sp. cg2]
MDVVECVGQLAGRVERLSEVLVQDAGDPGAFNAAVPRRLRPWLTTM